MTTSTIEDMLHNVLIVLIPTKLTKGLIIMLCSIRKRGKVRGLGRRGTWSERGME